jgi:inner membrane protein
VASVGHIAIGLIGARVLGHATGGTRRAGLFLSMLSLAPDLDVIGMRFGVPYGAEWGHRSATHSLVLAVVAAAAIALALRRGQPLRWFAPIAVAVLVSHGLLDAMTDGGRGVALLWPWSLHRFFFPWRPIPVAPIGSRILSPDGIELMIWEAILFAPAWVFAFWPARAVRRRAPGSSSPRGRRVSGPADRGGHWDLRQWMRQ